jgi:hypothetical protein
MSQSQILDILIDWSLKKDNSGKPILDLLTKEYDLKYIGGSSTKVSPLDVIFMFKNDIVGKTKFEEVIKLINNARENLKTQPIEKQAELIKKQILSSVKSFPT